MRTLVLFVIALAAPADQGRTCKANRDCPSPMSCVKTGERRSCQIRCSRGENECPEDQRCVKDFGVYLCRPIIDGATSDGDGLW